MARCYYVLCLRFVFYLIVITCDTLIKSYLLTYRYLPSHVKMVESYYFASLKLINIDFKIEYQTKTTHTCHNQWLS